MAIREISLFAYRNHSYFSIANLEQFVFISGHNGVGKTNILEAISLFAPGRGFRNSASEEFFNLQERHLKWRATINLNYQNDDLRFITEAQKNIEKVSSRILKVNDELITKHNQILHYLRIIWLTPQVDRLFIEAPAFRRKFIDRITYNFFPNHLYDILNYEKLLKSRIRLLIEGDYDSLWVDALEQQLAQLSISIFLNRQQCLQKIINELERSSHHFIKPALQLQSKIDEMLSEQVNIAPIIEKFRYYRKIDTASRRTNFGVHKTDLIAFHPQKLMPAAQCSTGEQKAMMLAIILAQARALKSHSSASLILLLDEIFTHLGIELRREFINELAELGLQTWITSTESSLQDELPIKKSIISL